MRPGESGHPIEIYPEHILTHGAPTEEVVSAYRQATWRVEIGRVVPGKRRVGVSDDVRPAKSPIPSTKPQCRTY